MRILLANLTRDPRETMFPLELAAAAAVLKRAGHETAGIDVCGRSTAVWAEAAQSHDVILLAPDSHTWPQARTLLQSLKTKPERLVIVGGIHGTFYTHEVLAEEAVDVALRGELDLAVGQIIDAWKDGPAELVPGAVWQSRWIDRGFKSAADFERIDPLDQLPLADRETFDVDAYRGMATRRPRYTQIVSGRGCDRLCAWYPISPPLPGGRKARSPQRVVDEMIELHQQHGIDEFHFEDEGLFGDSDYAAELCREIRDRLPRIVFQCPCANHPDDVTEQLLEKLAGAGCYRLYLGLHSPAESAMRFLGWHWHPERIESLAACARSVGIELGGYFTLGLPDESAETMARTVRFAVESGLAWAQFTPFSFTPGSEVYQLYEELVDRLPKQRLVRRSIRRAYWRFYGSRGRWRTALSGFNRRNAGRYLKRAMDKLLRGRS